MKVLLLLFLFSISLQKYHHQYHHSKNLNRLRLKHKKSNRKDDSTDESGLIRPSSESSLQTSQPEYQSNDQTNKPKLSDDVQSMQNVEIVPTISQYSKVDLKDKIKGIKGIESQSNQGFDSYSKMTETPFIQHNVVYDQATTSMTPIDLKDIQPLWNNYNNKYMKVVDYPSKRIKQMYPITNDQRKYEDVLIGKPVPISAQYHESIPSYYTNYESPLQRQEIHHTRQTTLMPTNIAASPLDQIIGGMKQEISQYHTRMQKKKKKKMLK